MEITKRARELYISGNTWLCEGVAVVPAWPKSKKCTVTWSNYQKNLPTSEQVWAWFQTGRPNIAVICGTGGLLVLDFDDQAKYQLWKLKAGPLVETYSESTSRGVHLFYKVDEPFTRRFIECEALGVGHLCLVAPSIHPDGSEYKITCDPITPIIRITTKELFFLLSEKRDDPSTWNPPAALNNNKPAIAIKDGPASRIKAAIPLIKLASDYTNLIRNKKGFYVGLCPIHQKNGRSHKELDFSIEPNGNYWKCFNANCPGYLGGDVITLYMYLKGLSSLSEAIRQLAAEVL